MLVKGSKAKASSKMVISSILLFNGLVAVVQSYNLRVKTCFR